MHGDCATQEAGIIDGPDSASVLSSVMGEECDADVIALIQTLKDKETLCPLTMPCFCNLHSEIKPNAPPLATTVTATMSSQPLRCHTPNSQVNNKKHARAKEDRTPNPAPLKRVLPQTPCPYGEATFSPDPPSSSPLRLVGVAPDSLLNSHHLGPGVVFTCSPARTRLDWG